MSVDTEFADLRFESLPGDAEPRGGPGDASVRLAQRALDEALKQSLARPMFGKTLADLQLTQAALADMATAARQAGGARLSALRSEVQGALRALRGVLRCSRLRAR